MLTAYYRVCFTTRDTMSDAGENDEFLFDCRLWLPSYGFGLCQAMHEYKEAARKKVLTRVAYSLKRGYGQCVLRGLDAAIKCTERVLDLLEKQKPGKKEMINKGTCTTTDTDIACMPTSPQPKVIVSSKSTSPMAPVKENEEESYDVVDRNFKLLFKSYLVKNANWVAQCLIHWIDTRLDKACTCVWTTLQSSVILLGTGLRKTNGRMIQFVGRYAGKRAKERTLSPSKVKEIASRRKVSPRKRLIDLKQGDIRTYLTISENKDLPQGRNTPEAENKRKYIDVTDDVRDDDVGDDDVGDYDVGDDDGDDYSDSGNDLAILLSGSIEDDKDDLDFDPTKQDASFDSLEYAECHTESDIEIEDQEEHPHLVQLKQVIEEHSQTVQVESSTAASKSVSGVEAAKKPNSKESKPAKVSSPTKSTGKPSAVAKSTASSSNVRGTTTGPTTGPVTYQAAVANGGKDGNKSASPTINIHSGQKSPFKPSLTSSMTEQRKTANQPATGKKLKEGTPVDKDSKKKTK